MFLLSQHPLCLVTQHVCTLLIVADPASHLLHSNKATRRIVYKFPETSFYHGRHSYVRLRIGELLRGEVVKSRIIKWTNDHTAQEEKQRLKQFLESVLESKHVRGDVLFSSVAGSHSLYV